MEISPSRSKMWNPGEQSALPSCQLRAFERQQSQWLLCASHRLLSAARARNLAYQLPRLMPWLWLDRRANASQRCRAQGGQGQRGSCQQEHPDHLRPAPRQLRYLRPWLWPDAFACLGTLHVSGSDAQQQLSLKQHQTV